MMLRVKAFLEVLRGSEHLIDPLVGDWLPS
jgi:hypothetical protein